MGTWLRIRSRVSNADRRAVSELSILNVYDLLISLLILLVTKHSIYSTRSNLILWVFTKGVRDEFINKYLSTSILSQSWCLET